jgi:hypothetical protein
MTIFERLKNWWLGTAPTPAQPAPDSVESVIIVDRTPQPAVPAAACGCGRSDTGLCVGLHLLSDEEWAAKTASKAAPVAEPVAAPAAAAPVTETVVEVVAEPEAAPAPVPEAVAPLSVAETVAEPVIAPAPVPEPVAAMPPPAKPKRERKPRAAKPAPQPAPEVVAKKPARTSRKKAQ